MKSYKNLVLSLLLFSFMLLVMHDYIFISTYSNISQTKVLSNTNDDVDITKAKLKLQMHNSFHVLLELPIKQNQNFEILNKNEKPSYYQKYLLSRIYPVLLRPPLS